MPDARIVRYSIAVNVTVIVLVLYMTVNVMFRIVDVVDYAASQDVYLFFTDWSNYLAAIVSLGTLYCIHKGIRSPRILLVLKLAAVTMLTITLVVVVFVLVPYQGWVILLNPEGSLMAHLINPVLMIVDFLYLSDMKPMGTKEALLSTIPMLLYVVFIVVFLIIAGNDDLAPYPFLRIHSQPVLMTLLVGAGVFVTEFVVSYAYTKVVKRTNPNLRQASI
ncbi:hypothetical protein AUP07_1299 [methanogenic archaeon mixed culture ISO4-G1]|nr:hypothetical protein AUP07_1299 [methanogenic archaeon mixed culture ISO4-G1]